MILLQSSSSSQQSEESKEQTREFIKITMKSTYEKIKILQKNRHSNFSAEMLQDIYYTPLRNGILQIEWKIEVNSFNAVSISTSYSLMSSLMIPLISHNIQELGYKIKQKNLQISSSFMKYTQKGGVLALNLILSYNFDRSFRSIFQKLIKCIEKEMRSDLIYYLPYLTSNTFILGSIKDKTLSQEKRKQNLQKIKEILLYSEQARISRYQLSKDIKNLQKLHQKKLQQAQKCIKLIDMFQFKKQVIEKDDNTKKDQQSLNAPEIKYNKKLVYRNKIVSAIKIKKIISQTPTVIVKTEISQIIKQRYLFIYLSTITLIENSKAQMKKIKIEDNLYQNLQQTEYEFDLGKKLPLRRDLQQDKNKQLMSQISVWSFENELNLITFLRNSECCYIGKYFLNKNELKSLYLQIYPKSLLQLVQQISNCKKIINFNTRLLLLVKICKGVNFLHERNIVHRDLKLNNIMIDNKLNPKIIDFGSNCQTIGYNDYCLNQIPLASTKGYYLSYKDLPQQIKEQYKQYQYYRHRFFDSYSLGTIIEYLFQKQLNNNQNDISLSLKYIISACHDLVPDRRLSPSQITNIVNKLLQS